MSIESWLLDGIKEQFIGAGEALAFFKSYVNKSAALKPVIVKRRVRRTKAQIAADAAKYPAQPAKRLGRKPGSKNRQKAIRAL